MTMWINNPNETSPWFHLRALHPHSLDIMRYFCGDVERVHAFLNRAPGRVCYSNAQINLQFANGVVGHLTGSYDTDPRHNLERCEVLGTKGRFVLDNLYEELTFYPRGGQELTVIRNSIMGGLSGFNATFTNRIHRWLEQVTAGVDRKEIEASGREGLAVQEIIEAAIRSHETGRAEEAPRGVMATKDATGDHMTTKIGLGVISFAHGHANLYCQRLATYDDVQLVAAWDDDATRGSAAAEQYGMRYSPHLEDLLDDPAIQGVIVTCETNRHAEMVLAAARAGKHILCQKPMALTPGRLRPHGRRGGSRPASPS